MDARVAVFGTAADRAAGAEIAAAVPGRCLDLTGRTSLAQAMAMIGRCDLFVTNDSGLMHVAAAMGTPLAAIFGSTDPVATGPFSEKVRVVRRRFDCQPCFAAECRRDFRCMTSITVDDVMAAARELIEQGK
jgi:heptosyltransferase-2